MIHGYREGLSARLPEYMVPGQYVLLEKLPLTTNGKVDRKALPAPEGGAGQEAMYVAPRNAVEQALCEIWQEVLKREQVGVEDNFFSLGGDSILSIQMVSRANRAGMSLTMRQMFENPTIAELALQVERAVRQERPQEAVEGELSLLPIQREFFAHDALSYQHYNQSVLLITPVGFSYAMLEELVEALYRRHDALRLRFSCVDGVWRAMHAPMTAEMVRESCVLERLPEQESRQAGFISERCGYYQRSLDIGAGPLLRAVYLEGEKQGRLFLVVHHLVVDGVSWRVMLGDLEQGYGQMMAGQRVELGAKSSSYQQWGEALARYAGTTELEREREYWRAGGSKQARSWLVKPLSTAAASYGSSRSAGVKLSVEETAALLKQCPAVYRTGINELLLAGVYWGLRKWSGARRVRITLEGHGREELFAELDTTETVGWFTTTYPVVLESDGEGMREIIQGVKEQYRKVPHHGIGYGVLRYVAEDEVLKAGEEENPPALLFNYLGQLDQMVRTESAFAMAGEGTGDAIDGQRRRSHGLGLNGMVAGGMLRFQLDYSVEQYREEQMKELARKIEEGLEGVIRHCLEVGEGDYTPSDFPLAKVDQGTLDRWQRAYRIERLYPATAMQKGMLFHGLLDREAYITQLYPTLVGDLDLAVLRQAWEEVVERHAIFRTIFVGEGEEQHQLVLREGQLGWHEEDWSGEEEAEQEERFEQYRRADKARGFELDQAPLMRVSVFRLGEQRYRMLWSQHHSLLDGWSAPLVYRDVMQAYQALEQRRGLDMPAAPEYERYMEWLLGKDREEARKYWREYLAEVETVTRLPYDKQARGEQEPVHGKQTASLGVEETGQLKELAKKHQTTINTLVQLAWGVLLQRYSGDRQVVFGAVISGRSAEVEEIERMVGLFINTIPVVVNFEGETELGELIEKIQSTFQRSQEYGYLPLTEIQKQSGLSRGMGLFESLLVFENYPLDSAMEREEEKGRVVVEIEEMGTDIQDTYPIALGVVQAETVYVSCNYFGHLWSEEAVKRMLGQLMYVLEQLPGCRRTEEIRLLRKEEEQQVVEWNATDKEYRRERVEEQFEEQAEKTPEAVAMVCGEKSLSYGELNEKAERLARYLEEAGVGEESRVGIYVNRSLEMMIGVLGVLKAGGAYVPLEPGLPVERVKYMVEDAGIEWVLAESGTMGSLPLGGVDVVMMDGAGEDEGWLEEMSEGSNRNSNSSNSSSSGKRKSRKEERRNREEERRRETGLHPVHVGIDGEAEGSDGGAWRAVELYRACMCDVPG